MNKPKHPETRTLPRRTVLKAAGLGAGAGLLSGIVTPASAADIWSAEYWAKKSDKKGEVKLNLWRKRAGAPKEGEPALPVVFLVHGSSNGDRQFVILPQTAHNAGYSKNRHLLYYALRNFLAAPAPLAL